MEVAHELAKRITAFSYDTLPAQAIHNAKTVILDTLGVALAGSREDAPRLVLKVPGISDPGPCLVLGFGVRTTALNAALVNGVSAHAMDFDDVNIALGGHPSAVLLPGLFAAAEIEDASGRDFLAAFVAGFETETRIARGVNFFHYEKGWHPTTTLGVFGAAAACSRLLRLSGEQTARALAIAASLASGIKANFGTMTKPLHVGHCSRNGLFAALLAREGCTANTQAFEHKQGFFNVYNDAGTFDAQKIFEGWAEPLDIVRPGTGIKLYPCCGSAHASIDAMITLRGKYQPAPEEVERIHARIHARRLVHINRPDPQSALDAKFSVQYCVARALLEGKVVVGHFGSDAFHDPAVRAVMRKIEVEPYTNPPPDAGDHYAVDLTVTMRSGAQHSVRVERPCGRSPEDPVPPERLKAKFESCAGRALPPRQVARLHAALEDLENAASMRDVAALIAQGRNE
ncbi:MAG: MmgE/PrpD family protein [Betaproteobacteria bacterium]|nr:MmgE/PrpD family protein [Betaproteobacteria bacterium]